MYAASFSLLNCLRCPTTNIGPETINMTDMTDMTVVPVSPGRLDRPNRSTNLPYRAQGSRSLERKATTMEV